MAVTRRGRRSIIVNGNTWYWSIRARPTYCQGNEWSNLLVAITSDSGKGVLIVDTGQPHPSAWLGSVGPQIRPSDVRRWIVEARAKGWGPATSGRFLMDGFLP